MEEMAFIPSPGQAGAMGTLTRLAMFPQVSGSLTMTLHNSLTAQKRR